MEKYSVKYDYSQEEIGSRKSKKDLYQQVEMPLLTMSETQPELKMDQTEKHLTPAVHFSNQKYRPKSSIPTIARQVKKTKTEERT